MTDNNSTTENMIELSKIEGDIDTALLLKKRQIITSDVCADLAENAMSKLYVMYRDGGINSSALYDLAMTVSDKLHDADYDRDPEKSRNFWTLFHEQRLKEPDNAFKERIIAESGLC
ncbi:hypothetical protein IFU23_24470 [Pantoea agglomerans]|uniref:Uncharacterized protein n=1 Tax=Enterobacter agglomerans TaxID=549 RepID=A0ACC5PVY9_ENTAG|nr:hypothetical protein [Pantoea agglomerans]MBD8129387.1 hypothetical protein [Pantoea agglomerans]MBD8156480.1 hypothetical protein [Pantoea agglomerans]MBD8161231.1 hypothetical protein [Pantoea agglomerans]MBD8234897.1 hypothetical protein [Pantoea agglomerans]MBD8245296.1 hypothetical protein [Pantoea agglomerans]